MPSLLRHSTALKLALLGGLLLLVLLLSLPLIVQRLAVDWFQQQGLEARIDNIDINPFTGEIMLEGLTLSDGTTQPLLQLGRLQIDLAMMELVRQRVQVDMLLLANTRLRVNRNETGLRIAGLETRGEATGPDTTAGDEETSGWQFGIRQLSFYDNRIDYRIDGLSGRLHIQQASLRDLQPWQPNDTSHVALQLRLDDTPVELRGQIWAFTARPRAELQLQVSELPLQDFASALPTPLKLTGRVSANQRIVAETTAQTTEISLRGSLQLSEPRAEQEARRFSAEHLHWQGLLGLTTQRDARPQIHLDGRLAGGKLSVVTPSYTVKLQDLQLDALLNHDGQDNVSGNIELQLDRGLLEEHRLVLARWRELRLQGGQIERPGAYRIQHLGITGLTLLESAPEPVARLRELDAADIGIDGFDDIRIGRMEMAALQAHIVRRQDGRLVLADIPGTEDAAGPPSSRQGDTASSRRIRIGRIEIDDTSQLRFTDHSVVPSFDTRLHQIALSIRQLDTQGPPFPLSLQARLDDYGSLRLQGRLQPFGPRLNAELEAELKQVSLAPLSSYTARHLGYVLKRGQMDARLDVRIDDSQLDIQTRLLLRKLRLAARDTAEGREFKDQLAMPLDKTLDLLRDKDDNIELRLPITGRLDDPQFHFAKIINKASAKALKLATIQYLKMTLQPWGTLYSVAQLAGKAAALRLDPLPFAPGSSALAPQQQDYLAKLAELLRQRPRLTLALCGLATRQDEMAQAGSAPAPNDAQADAAPPQADIDRLKALARERALAVKRILVERHGIAAERLLICHPEFLAEDSPPRLDITL